MGTALRTVRTAIAALRRHAMRSLLTCIGIVIGIAAVIAMMEIGQGTSESIRQTIASMGANQLIVMAGSASSSGISWGGGTALTLVPDDCEAIIKQCNAVRLAAPGVDCRMQVVYGNRNWVPWNVLGTTPEYLTVRDWADLEEGEAFTDADVRNGTAVCLLGQTPAHALFGDESPLGKEVRVSGLLLRVLGVLKRKGASMMGRDQDDLVIAPWTTVKFRLNGGKLALNEVNNNTTTTSVLNQVNTLNRLYPNQQMALYPQQSAAQIADTPRLTRCADLDDIYVQAKTSEEVEDAIGQITELLRDRHHLRPDQLDDFRVRDLTEMSRALGETSERMTQLLLCVALISLVVGGVGIMNIMLVSVTERTREIGLRMAVGARARDVLRQFLTEAITLCMLGGIMGVLLGRGISISIRVLFNWPTTVSLAAIFAAVIVSVTVGVVFGYYPAWKASRLDPIEALRHE
jgi:ABC-type antimicrobial peptide transport system permease subunit